MRPLEGVRVVEVSAWAFVPSAGAALAEWGADVVKIEPPSGDPIRGLVNGGLNDAEGIAFPWELWNRGKRAISLDLEKPEAQEIVGRLCEQADVFLTSKLPAVRRKLGIDENAIRSRNPSIIYASGSGYGYEGDEADNGGFDAITFWSRGGVAGAVSPDPAKQPTRMPCGAFGDSLSGLMLAGGIAAAVAHQARTGEGGLVDGSLLATALWSMQMAAAGASVAGAQPGHRASNDDAAAPNGASDASPDGGGQWLARSGNPLVNDYITADGRWVGLCMLQRDTYWDGLMVAIGRPDILDDARFASVSARNENVAAAAVEIASTFRNKSLDHWRNALAQQPGQWDVVQNVQELLVDPQAVANGYVQHVEYASGRRLPMYTTPVHFDRTAPVLRRAPEFAADTFEVLSSIGMDVDDVIEAQISGAVI